MNRAPTFITVLAASAAFAAPALAAPGDLDTAFAAPDGFVVPPQGETAVDSFVQPDGSAVVALTSPGQQQALQVARYRPDGSLDTSFNGAGAQPGVASVHIGPRSPESAAALARQADGKIVVAGSSSSRIAVVRLNPDGTPDPGFNDASAASPPGAVVTDLGVPDGDARARTVAIGADGKIVVIGQLGGTSSSPLLLARYLPDGSLDTQTFNDSDGATPDGTGTYDLPGEERINGGVVRPDGSVIAVGSTTADGTTKMLAAHVRANGLPDPGFGPDGSGAAILSTGDSAGGDAFVNAVSTPEGVVVAGASDADGDSARGDTVVGRLTAQGAPDPRFGTDGFVELDLDSIDLGIGLDRLPDGRLLVSGVGGPALKELDLRLSRLTPDGHPDPSFGSGGSVRRSLTSGVDEGLTVSAAPDGRVVVAGVSIFADGTNVPFVARFEGGDPAVEQAPPAPPAPPARDTKAPTVDALSLSRKRVVTRGRRRGTAFGFRLSEDATVRIAIARGGKRAGSLERRRAAGKRRVSFSGKLGGRALKPGSYRATVVAADAAGNRSKPRRIRFRVVR